MKKIFVIFVVCLCTMPSVVFGECVSTESNVCLSVEQFEKMFGDKNYVDYPKVMSFTKDKTKTDKVSEISISNCDDLSNHLRSALDRGNILVKGCDKKQSSSKNNNNSTEPQQTSNNSHDEGDPLYKAMLSRSVDAKKLCVADLGGPKSDPEECAYISSDFGICDTHVYNKKLFSNSTNSEDIENVREMVATKITVISQQMYKQYEYLSSTLRRLRTQLQKAVLMADLEMAGGNSEKSSSGSYSRNNDKEIVLAGAQNCWNSGDQTEAYRCIQQNVNLVKSNIQTNRKQAKDQLVKTYAAAKQWGIIACSEYTDKDQKECKDEKSKVCEEKNLSDANSITKCANDLSISVARAISAEQEKIMQYTGNRRY